MHEAFKKALDESVNEQFGPIVAQHILSGRLGTDHMWHMAEQADAAFEVSFREACLEVAGLAAPMVKN